MKVCVIGNDAEKEELLSQGLAAATVLVFVQSPADIPVTDEPMAIIDLLFDESAERIQSLERIASPVVLINAVTGTLRDLPDHFIRINGWPGFLNRNIMEAASKNEKIKETASNVISGFTKKVEWVPDIPGFITARIVSAIINEAYFSLEEKVSSREDIDIAMKTGTNYPYGPFEWGDKIGLKNVYALLEILSQGEQRYTPASLLKETALK